MGECQYCIFIDKIEYGRFQCSKCIPSNDFCSEHLKTHLHHFKSHKDSIFDKQTMKMLKI